jgi:hypothetical protein
MWDVMPRGTLYHWSFRHLGHIALGFLSRFCFALGRFVDAAILLVGYVLPPFLAQLPPFLARKRTCLTPDPGPQPATYTHLPSHPFPIWERGR